MQFEQEGYFPNEPEGQPTHRFRLTTSIPRDPSQTRGTQSDIDFGGEDDRGWYDSGQVKVEPTHSVSSMAPSERVEGRSEGQERQAEGDEANSEGP